MPRYFTAFRPVVALVATVGLIVLSAGPAAAVDPGDGSVIFNPDGTPIGSELLYDGGTTPQYVYTSETEDDDFWGFDVDSVPAHIYNQFDPLAAGIPLGFTATVAGISYDEVLVNSNGGVCLISSADPTLQGSDVCDDFYYNLIGSIFDPAYTGGPTNYAAFLPFTVDQNPVDSETPIDTDSDAIFDACENGSYLFEFSSTFYCSSVFWGTTTYEGKNAFVATWYHDPEYGSGNETDFNTYQVLLVNDGGGDLTVVYNYDEVHHGGQDLDYYASSSTPTAAACGIAFTGGDTAAYYQIGMGGVNFTDSTSTYLDLFGPACDGGNSPHTAAELINGGSYELASHNLNSTVPGRYVFRVVDGLPTLVLPAAVADPELAATGAAPVGVLGGAVGMLLLGSFILLVGNRKVRDAKA